MHHPFLVGERCYLRGLEHSDLGDPYFQWFNDQQVTRFMRNGAYPNSESRMRAFFEQMSSSQSDVVLAIITREGERHIGNVGLHRINWLYRTAEMGIIIGDREWQGKGIGTEAMRLLVGHAFKRLNLNRIVAVTDEENTASVRAFEKAGFVREGLLREDCFRLGEYKNSVLLALLRREFLD